MSTTSRDLAILIAVVALLGAVATLGLWFGAERLLKSGRALPNRGALPTKFSGGG